MHLETLKECLPGVTMILTVGWRGAEDHFLGLLKSRLSESVKIMAVAGSIEGARKTGERILAHGIPGTVTQLSGLGFSRFVLEREVERFLKI